MAPDGARPRTAMADETTVSPLVVSTPPAKAGFSEQRRRNDEPTPIDTNVRIVVIHVLSGIISALC